MVHWRYIYIHIDRVICSITNGIDVVEQLSGKVWQWEGNDMVSDIIIDVAI